MGRDLICAKEKKSGSSRIPTKSEGSVIIQGYGEVLRTKTTQVAGENLQWT